MAKEKVDLRIVKTRKAIKEAFLLLIQSKGYERITVQDIADKAMINRNTFYLHYVDKPDLMEKLCQESMDQLNVCFNLGMTDTDARPIDKPMLITLLREIFNAVKADMFFFKMMLSLNGNPSFSTDLNKALTKYIKLGITDYEETKKIKIGLEYMVSGLVGVICMWIVESDQLEVEEVIEHLSEFHLMNILNLLDNLK